MQVFRGTHHPGIAPACALTIGNFDGVHRGHQAMLALLRSEARHRGLPSCVVTFEPNPRVGLPSVYSVYSVVQSLLLRIGILRTSVSPW